MTPSGASSYWKAKVGWLLWPQVERPWVRGRPNFAPLVPYAQVARRQGVGSIVGEAQTSLAPPLTDPIQRDQPGDTTRDLP